MQQSISFETMRKSAYQTWKKSQSLTYSQGFEAMVGTAGSIVVDCGNSGNIPHLLPRTLITYTL